MTARCTLTCLIPGQFIFSKLLIVKAPNSEFLLYVIILFGCYGFKGIIFSLIALLDINIGFGSIVLTWQLKGSGRGFRKEDTILKPMLLNADIKTE